MKRTLFILLMLLVVLPVLHIVSATIDTTITVQSGVNQMITLIVLNPSSGDALLVFNETQTDNLGKAIFTYTAGSRISLDFSVTVRGLTGNIIIKPKKFIGYFAGDIVFFDLRNNSATANTTTTTNTTSTTSTNATTTVVNTTNSTSTTVKTNVSTGPSIFSKSFDKGKDFIVAKWIWIVGVLVAIIIIYVLIRLAPLIKDKIESMPKAPAPSLDNRPKSKIESQLLEAEKKIKQAQAEIDSLRNKESKVKDAERRFEEAKRELERAKRF